MLIVTVPILCATCIRHSAKGPWTSHLRVTTIGLVLNSNWPSAKTIVLLKVLHPLPDPHHHNSFVFQAGLEPGILAREAGALPRRLKASSVSAPLFEVRWGLHSLYWHTSVILTLLNLTPVRVTAPMLHPLPDPHHHNSFVFRAGLEPGILARRRRSTKEAKGYSL